MDWGENKNKNNTKGTGSVEDPGVKSFPIPDPVDFHAGFLDPTVNTVFKKFDAKNL
jgi:hypothetical protein